MNPLPKEYQNFYDEIMTDQWLVKKVDRDFRINGEQRHIDKYLPEIKKGGLHILDIGAGPGEFSELSMGYGCSCFDIIAPAGQMPYYYEEYCRIQHIRNNIPFIQINFFKYLNSGTPYIPNKKFDLINCKHAINLIFYDHIVPPVPSHTLYTSENNMMWVIDDKLKYSFNLLFNFFDLTINKNGIVMISALKTGNNAEYSNFITGHAESYGYKTIINEHFMVHKFTKL